LHNERRGAAAVATVEQQDLLEPVGDGWRVVPRDARHGRHRVLPRLNAQMKRRSAANTRRAAMSELGPATVRNPTYGVRRPGCPNRQARLGPVSRKAEHRTMPKGFASERDLNPSARDLRICVAIGSLARIIAGQRRATVSEGGLEHTKSRIFPDSALEYADGGEIPSSGISCAHASGHDWARVKWARRLWRQGRAGAIPGVTAASRRSAGALPVGYGSRRAVQRAPRSADLCTWPAAGAD
jgi:hypothetical protein